MRDHTYFGVNWNWHRAEHVHLHLPLMFKPAHEYITIIPQRGNKESKAHYNYCECTYRTMPAEIASFFYAYSYSIDYLLFSWTIVRVVTQAAATCNGNFFSSASCLPCTSPVHIMWTSDAYIQHMVWKACMQCHWHCGSATLTPSFKVPGLYIPS